MIASDTPRAAPLNVILIAVGSHGDVLPFLAIGRELQARGHRVTFCTNGMFITQVHRFGFEYVEVGTAEEYLALVANPEMFHPTRGLKLLAEPLLRMLRGIYGAIEERYIPGRTVVVGSNTAFAGRLAQEKLGVPLATVALQPAWFFSPSDPPVLHPRLGRLKTAPKFIRKLVIRVMGRVMNSSLGVPLAQVRRELALPPLRDVASWSFSPQAVIGLFPEWFAPRQHDWPQNFQYDDFPMFDEWDTPELSPEAAEFIAAGDPPIVFTAGSAMTYAEPIITAAVDACLRLGRRGIILSTLAKNTGPLPPSVRMFSYAPFSKLLPHAAALVHHCGVGTLSQALRAGVPQLVTPFAFDQPDNAWRIERLGVARQMSMRGITGRRLARTLEGLLQSSDVAAACRRYAEKTTTASTLDVTCHAIESLAGAEAATA